jgi:ribosomal protein S18 acetylase RimI-like enzyme
VIALVPMTEEEFPAYLAEAVRDHARDKVEAGQWSEDSSLRLAREGFDDLLPQGLATPGNHVFTLTDPATRAGVGVLWFAIQQRAGESVAYVYDVLVRPQFQRRGYATQAFAALEAEAASRGLSGVALHVFGHNSAARALYDKLGFEPTNISMFKRVARAAGRVDEVAGTPRL